MKVGYFLIFFILWFFVSSFLSYKSIESSWPMIVASKTGKVCWIKWTMNKQHYKEFYTIQECLQFVGDN